MFTPVVPLDAAEPEAEITLADAPEVTTQPENVYLSRVINAPLTLQPKANIPTVEFPAADPTKLAALADVAELTTQPEYVYLSRVRTPEAQLLVEPKANIPMVDVPVAAPA
jgi:hypothetical protein